MLLTPEQQALLDGKEGEIMARIVKTLVMYGDAFGAERMVLFTVCAYGKQPACMLFSKPIDSLAASGAILADVWSEAKMPVVDNLGEEFLDFVKDGMQISVGEDGLVTVE